MARGRGAFALAPRFSSRHFRPGAVPFARGSIGRLSALTGIIPFADLEAGARLPRCLGPSGAAFGAQAFLGLPTQIRS
jgi:hypothetical protein